MARVKSRHILLAAFIIMLGISRAQEKGSDFPILKGLYLGQKPPGVTPEVFAPGIISTSAHEYCIAVSKDLNEIYLKRMINGKGMNLVFCYAKNKWNEAKEVELGDEGKYGEINLTPDGKHLLANQITLGAGGSPQCAIVRFSRTNGAWTGPTTVGQGMRATSTGKGDVYVTRVLDAEKSLGAIGVFRRLDAGYGKIEMLEGDINIEHVSSSHPFIAPDESFLIFDSKRVGDSLGCLYISFSRNGQSWSKPQNLSKRLKTSVRDDEWIATVSPDGLYLFYNVGSDIYWVSAKIIEELRPKE